MKTIIAIAISSLFTTGVYAQSAKQNMPLPQVNSSIDDNSRQAIMDALGTDSTDKKISANPVNVTKPINQEIKPVIKPVINNTTPVINSSVNIVKPVKIVESIKPVESIKNIAVIVPTKNISVEPIQKPIETPKKTLDTKNVIEPTKTIKLGTATSVTTNIKKDDLPPVITKSETIVKQGNAIKDIKVETKIETKETVKTTTTEKPIIGEAKLELKQEIKPIINHTLKKHHKHIYYKKTLTNTNKIDLVKNPYSVSEAPYELLPIPESGYLYKNQINSNLLIEKDGFHLKITDFNGNSVSLDNLRNTNNYPIIGYFVSSDLKDISLANASIDSNNNYIFTTNKNITCKTLFVQYQLKTNDEPTTINGYINNNGEYTHQFDAKCTIPKSNIKDNISYSNENNLIGIFLNDVEQISTKPVVYDIINNRNGKTYIPKNLESFIIGKDFNSFYIVKPISHKDGILGYKFSQKLKSGSYYVVGQFLQEGKEESALIPIYVK